MNVCYRNAIKILRVYNYPAEAFITV